MQADELVITEDNFEDYFFDVRKHTPQHGQIMARYSAVAEFIDGQMKRDVIELLLKEGKAEAAAKVMRKLGCAAEADSYRIPRQMAEDLLHGETVEQVAQKPYRYTLEAFYYTRKEYVPLDPHWTIIGILNLDEFLDKANQKIRIVSKVMNAAEGQSEAVEIELPPDR